MEFPEIRKELIKKAMEKHPGVILHFCGDAKSWENCFTVEDYRGKTYLFFWYNLPSGHTMTVKAQIEITLSK